MRRHTKAVARTAHAWFRATKESSRTPTARPPNGPNVVTVMWGHKAGADPINDHLWASGRSRPTRWGVAARSCGRRPPSLRSSESSGGAGSHDPAPLRFT